MSKFYETKKFNTLNKEWQKKLKDSGFEDIEDIADLSIDPQLTREGDYRLKQWALNFTRNKKDFVRYEAKETYYRLAGQFLHEHKFKTPLEHEIWRLHSEGVSLAKIDVLTGQKQSKAARIVKTLAKLMFCKQKEESNDE